MHPTPKLTAMTRPWSDRVAATLLDTSRCPRCESPSVVAGACRTCGADLRGPVAVEVWQASIDAAAAVNRRQDAIDRLPALSRPPAAAGPTPGGTGTPAVAPPAAGAPVAEGSSSEVRVQSVLAAAGAGLFAVAALVFTFFNPDLADFTTRTWIIALITAAFLGGALLLARRGLQFSAESVGALGVVFVGLDVWSFSQAAPPSVPGYAFGAIGTVAGSLGLVWLARRGRIRVWLWSAAVGLTIAPALLGYAGGSGWPVAAGNAGVAFAGLAVLAVLPRLAGRAFDGPHVAERRTITTLQIAGAAFAALSLPVLQLEPAPWGGLSRSALLAALALVALLSSRYAARTFWSGACGALTVAAASVLPLALAPRDAVWYLALIPAAAATALVALRFTPSSRAAHQGALRWGAVSVAILGAVPAFVIAVAQLYTTPVGVLRAERNGSVHPELIPADLSAATVLGLAALAAGTWLLSPSAPPASAGPADASAPRPINPLRTIALWTSALALVSVPGLSALPLAARVAIAVVLATGLAIALRRFGPVADLPAQGRAPLVGAAHVLIGVAALLSWADRPLTVPAGVAILAALAVVASATRRSARFVYVGAGYAYGLVLFATALSDAGVGMIPLLCLTTTLGSVAALVVTLTDRLSPRSWYAVLVVTAVPFLLGVVSVLTERSGWTALSTGVTFALALALVLTRRPGLTGGLRAAAAALLVPSVAVVIVCLGAQVLAVSASPVTLPLIALVVACVLPSRGLLASGLQRRGLPEVDVAASVASIELSSLVTAALAVLLALVREASGLGTTFLVLLILGLGAAAASLFAGRRYGWWFAGAAWTGALWCVWAIVGVGVAEPYILPSAAALAIVGFLLTARRAPAVALYATGVAAAVVPSLAILAITGSRDLSEGLVPWRTAGLLLGAVLLLGLGWFVARRQASSPLQALTIPTLLGSVVAAGAGAVQAVRYGWGRDALNLADDELVMLPVLALSIAAAAIAATAAWVLLTSAGRTAIPRLERWFDRPRWLFGPAVVYLVAGPIAGIRPGWFPIWTLWTLALLLLVLMLVTVWRSVRTGTALPPVWFTFLVAWCTAVAGWSERELRVEAFSLPLGLALLAAGVLAARRPAGDVGAPGLPVPTLTSWPVGFRGSWRLFAPGIVVTMLPSVLATATDPLTARAILVIALALAAILAGLLLRLSAPFILGLAVLPIENVIVFAVQIGRSISAAPWWITLATAGAVLLVLAVGYERRSSRGGVVARLRDLG
jgi:hypothetical protein